jgi:hypothetical protein
MLHSPCNVRAPFSLPSTSSFVPLGRLRSSIPKLILSFRTLGCVCHSIRFLFVAGHSKLSRVLAGTVLEQLLPQVDKRFADLSLVDFPCRIPRFRHHRGEGGGGYAKYHGGHLHLSSFMA